MAPPAGPAEWKLPAEPGSVRTARALVGETLRAWRLDGLTDIAMLLVSELVTNSMRYAAGPVGVRLAQVRDRRGVRGLHVEVSDSLPDPPRPRATGPDDERGRGLQLLAAASRRWGTRCGGEGKAVWFELSLPG